MPLLVERSPLASTRIVCVDCLARVSAQDAADLAALNVAAAGRYVNLHEGPGGFAIDAAELDGITRSIGCWAIQEGRTGGWSDEAGLADGRAACRNAIKAGFPSGGCKLVCDFEGAIPRDVAAGYANRWFAGASEEGNFDLSLYVGAGVPLTSSELYHSLAFHSYWRSLSEVPNVEQRGYQLLQLYPDNVALLGPGRGRFDLNAAQSDYKGDRWSWAKAA